MIKIHRECQRAIYNALKRRSTLLTDKGTPPKVSTRRDTVNFEWKRGCFLCDKPYKIDKHHPDRIDWKSEHCQFGTKLSIYVKNKKINSQKKYTKNF